MIPKLKIYSKIVPPNWPYIYQLLYAIPVNIPYHTRSKISLVSFTFQPFLLLFVDTQK